MPNLDKTYCSHYEVSNAVLSLSPQGSPGLSSPDSANYHALNEFTHQVWLT